jgi:hypothetical protein
VNRRVAPHGQGIALGLGVLLLIAYFFDGRWGFMALAAALVVLGVGAGSLRSFTFGLTRMSMEWREEVAERIVGRSVALPEDEKRAVARNIASATTPDDFVDRVVKAGPLMHGPSEGPVPPGFTRFGGRVTDATTGAPIAGVCVYPGPPTGCPKRGASKTDGWGIWAVDLPSGASWAFNFERDGFVDVLERKAGDAGAIDVQMERRT